MTELWQGDRLIFTAKAVTGRSFSGDQSATGTWVVEAVAGDRPPMTAEGGPEMSMRDGKPLLDASPREIWLVIPDGTDGSSLTFNELWREVGNGRSVRTMKILAPG